MLKLSQKLVEDVVRETAGDDVLPLVNILKNKKNISEFKLAERMGKEVNSVRNMLYRLYHVNLVTFTRKKDKQKGWYIYYWTFKLKSVLPMALELKQNRMERLSERLERERGEQFFMCGNACMRLSFDQAMDFHFKCPECGMLMTQEDNTAKMKKLEEEFNTLEKEMKEEHKGGKKKKKGTKRGKR